MMKTSRFLFLLTVILTLTNCSEDVEKLAKPYLDRAQQSFGNSQYALAKLQIDSIKQLYPKAFETRAQAQALLIDIELAEASTSKHYTDSLLTVAQAKAEPLTTALYFDKDTRYQDIGRYYASRHRTEKNVGASYLRPQTDERGNFTITTFYRGRALSPHTLRFTASDGSYIDLQPTDEPYVMSDATGRTERTDFATTSEVAIFMSLQQTIKATLIGQERKAQIPFTKPDVQATIQVADLATVLQTITTLQTELQELTRRITFYEQRKEH